MNIIIDTSVWSLALRRQRSSVSAENEGADRAGTRRRAAMLGPVRQELLSGVRGEQQFETLRSNLRAFPDILLKLRTTRKPPLSLTDAEQVASRVPTRTSSSVQLPHEEGSAS